MKRTALQNQRVAVLGMTFQAQNNGFWDFRETGPWTLFECTACLVKKIAERFKEKQKRKNT